MKLKVISITGLPYGISDWSFTPSRAPHFGGLWESAVRLMKQTLKKVIGDQILWADEFTTLLYEAAVICNSRPLAPMETHPTDGVTPLTSGHFLTGAPLRSVPAEPDITQRSTYGRRWRLLQRMTSDLWKRWRKEYLLLLQRHSKWKSTLPNLRTGDIVLLKDNELFQRSWPMGIITKAYPGSDGLVRAVDVRIKNKIYRCPIHKLVKLLEEVRTAFCSKMLATLFNSVS